MNDVDHDLLILLDRFGDAVEVVFDGPAESCPICHGEVAQLRLELAPHEPVICDCCGAVLAA